MIILNVVLAIFIVLELFNILALYLKPSMKQANAVGVFNAWDKSKKDPQTHDFIKYLVYWVAGTKLIIISLLGVILVLAEPTLKIIAVGALAITISVFYWKMFPIIRQMDNDKSITPASYSRTLGIMVAISVLALCLSALFAYLNIL